MIQDRTTITQTVRNNEQINAGELGLRHKQNKAIKPMTPSPTHIFLNRLRFSENASKENGEADATQN